MILRRTAPLSLLLLVAALPLPAQLSPGKLSQAHASLEGSANCLKCHQPGKGVAPSRCLDCHTALGARIAARQGLHARPGHQKCETCHNEHHGREFQLVYWGKAGPSAFDHRQTGFPLEGAHAAQGCRECHRPAFLRNPPALKSGRANPSRTFLGLSRACLSCHRDEHRGQLAGQSCLSCHTMTGWRPPAKLDHARTSFPLTGRHATVACASCHPARSDALAADPDRKFTVFKGLAHQRCTDCHKDPHQGRFGPTCQSCHSTAGWKEGARTRFDHDRTGFPLTGQHRNVACASCHRTRGSSGEPVFARMAHGRCTDCHKDPHQGRLGTTCQSCHSTAGWRVAGVRADFDHARTRFPLRGQHRKVACQQCHAPGRPMRIAKFDRCADCHRDAHRGQLAGRPGGTACESCHTVEGFSPSTFTVADHQKGPYPLQGAHLAVPCVSCHRSAQGIQLRFPSTACRTCHGDPHHGEVDRFVSAGGCETCHSLGTWRRVTFDHDRTRFPLEGGHQRVACRSCHAPVDRGTPRERLRMKGTPMACAGCHGDPHQGQFARASTPLSCQQCHSVLSWTRITFDHDRSSRFKLEGAHRTLLCGACHKTETRDGKPFVRFKPLPVTCEGCHGAPNDRSRK
jgi:hypothetical protein